MKHHLSTPSLLARGALCLAASALPVRLPAQAPEPLVVCATTPNLGALVRAVTAGVEDAVELTVFCQPSQDPHHLRALPSFVKQLNRADLLVVVGLGLESGWIPALIDGARNPGVRPGGPRHVDASTVVHPLGVPDAGVDRAAGDLHARGNPHYLVDPASGASVAELLAERLGALRPANRERFVANAAALRERLGALVVGDELASTYDFTSLVRLHRAGRLREFLAAQGDLERLGGALGELAAIDSDSVIADHDAWRYLTSTLGLRTVGFLEPKPGIAPTTSHLRDLVAQAAGAQPRVLIHVPYFERRAIDFVVRNTGVRAVELAHQVGAAGDDSGDDSGDDAGDYVAMIETNLQRLVAGLRAEGAPGDGD